MRVTIIKDDNSVTVDGVGYRVDCSSLPADFHALQWDGDKGQIEYRTLTCDHCGQRSRKGNDLTRDLAPYAALISAWGVAKAEADKAEAERVAKEAAALAEATAKRLAAEEARRQLGEQYAAGPQD